MPRCSIARPSLGRRSAVARPSVGRRSAHREVRQPSCTAGQQQVWIPALAHTNHPATSAVDPYGRTEATWSQGNGERHADRPDRVWGVDRRCVGGAWEAKLLGVSLSLNVGLLGYVVGLRATTTTAVTEPRGVSTR